MVPWCRRFQLPTHSTARHWTHLRCWQGRPHYSRCGKQRRQGVKSTLRVPTLLRTWPLPAAVVIATTPRHHQVRAFYLVSIRRATAPIRYARSLFANQPRRDGSGTRQTNIFLPSGAWSTHINIWGLDFVAGEQKHNLYGSTTVRQGVLIGMGLTDFFTVLQLHPIQPLRRLAVSPRHWQNKEAYAACSWRATLRVQRPGRRPLFR